MEFGGKVLPIDISLRVISTQMTPKAMNLDGITKGMSVDRKKKRSKN